jgi:hypothetical protein
LIAIDGGHNIMVTQGLFPPPQVPPLVLGNTVVTATPSRTSLLSPTPTLQPNSLEQEKANCLAWLAQKPKTLEELNIGPEGEQLGGFVDPLTQRYLHPGSAVYFAPNSDLYIDFFNPGAIENLTTGKPVLCAGGWKAIPASALYQPFITALWLASGIEGAATIAIAGGGVGDITGSGPQRYPLVPYAQEVNLLNKMFLRHVFIAKMFVGVPPSKALAAFRYTLAHKPFNLALGAYLNQGGKAPEFVVLGSSNAAENAQALSHLLALDPAKLPGTLNLLFPQS